MEVKINGRPLQQRSRRSAEIFATGIEPVEYHGEYIKLTFVSQGTPAIHILMPAGAYRGFVRALLDAPPLVAQ